MASTTFGGDVDHDLVRRASEIRPLLAEHAARRHAFLATNVSLETYGRSMFDLDPIVVIV